MHFQTNPNGPEGRTELLATSGTDPTYTVAIINSFSDRLGLVVGTLISSDSLVAGLNTITASGDDIDLTSSTNYMVLVDVTNTGN